MKTSSPPLAAPARLISVFSHSRFRPFFPNRDIVTTPATIDPIDVSNRDICTFVTVGKCKKSLQTLTCHDVTVGSPIFPICRGGERFQPQGSKVQGLRFKVHVRFPSPRSQFSEPICGHPRSSEPHAFFELVAKLPPVAKRTHPDLSGKCKFL